MTIKHPVDRGGDGRSRFDRVAEGASNLGSSPAFFVFCLAIVAWWAATYIADLAEPLQHVAGDVMAALTLAMVALLKNAERRSESAVQQKLDLIAAALLERDSGDETVARDRLREAIGLHDEI